MSEESNSAPTPAEAPSSTTQEDPTPSATEIKPISEENDPTPSQAHENSGNIEKLKEFVAKAQKSYSQKDYSTASDIFADACELQAKINGSEDHPDNGYLLYLYGKSLFQYAVTKSDVLGGAATKEAQVKEAENVKVKAASSSSAGKPLAAISEESESLDAKKPYFSFQGDENWDDSDEDEEEGVGEGDEEESGTKEDDFQNAWEIIDLARVLYERKLRESDSCEPALVNLDEDERKLPPEEKLIRIKHHLADCYDILGEISLESEDWPKAKEDFTKSLKLKLEILPLESRLISEAHYKLSLSLEFESQMEDASEEYRQKGKEEAAVHLEKALESCKARLHNLELQETVEKGKGKAKEELSKEVKEAREIVEELEQRLVDLRAEPMEPDQEQSLAAKGILGEIIDMPSVEAKQKLNEAIEHAQDVTNLVRKKAKQSVTPTPPATETQHKEDQPSAIANGSNRTRERRGSNGKRKLNEVEDIAIEHIPAKEPKKAKVEDATDEEEREGGSAVRKHAMA